MLAAVVGLDELTARPERILAGVLAEGAEIQLFIGMQGAVHLEGTDVSDGGVGRDVRGDD